MKIINTYSWNRRDFRYDAQCEGCNHITKNNSGYDDANYYQNVMPDEKCPSCGESTNSMGEIITPINTKYPAEIVM